MDASSGYDPQRGYGWLTSQTREAVAIPLTPYLEVRAASHDPKNLPHDVLFRDYIHGNGSQKFAVDLAAGEYQAIFLHPDHTTTAVTLASSSGRVEVPFPSGDWSVSGLIIQRKSAEKPAPLPPESQPGSRPAFHHNPPKQISAGKDLPLALTISGSQPARKVRLYYRPLNQLDKFKVIEHAPSQAFVIPGADIPSNYSLMYYFEVLDDEGSGWFQPNPLTETPYYVVKTTPQIRIGYQWL